MAEKDYIAQQINRFYQIMAQKMMLDDSLAMEIADLYAPWTIDHSYAIGDIVRYGVNEDGETQLYTVLMAHTSQAEWTPDIAFSLYKKIGFTPSGYPVWTQPLSTSDAYMKDDIVSHKNELWISNVDNNVWEPSIYGWDTYVE